MKVGQRRKGTLNMGLAVAISGTVVVDAVGIGLTPGDGQAGRPPDGELPRFHVDLAETS